MTRRKPGFFVDAETPKFPLDARPFTMENPLHRRSGATHRIGILQGRDMFLSHLRWQCSPDFAHLALIGQGLIALGLPLADFCG